MKPLAKAKGMAPLHFFFDVSNFFSRFIFVEFKNVDDANLALVAMHNHPFDAKHQFKVNRFTDIERYEKLDETYVEPETEEYAPRVIFLSSPTSSVSTPRLSQEHLRAWLADPQGRDQYVTYRGEDVEIYWHGKPSQSEIAEKPVRLTWHIRSVPG